ncbi:hypothetical protein LMG31886_09250 [Xanthomonas hydrangeae]|nr:hypothetical protein LMG31884_09410 [Xanthomonas hydrangeae]CAD7714093.1 hypothetical protein LMG31884_09410 [Xanthomonas hydrangeae]CAD7722392.1 hypothetical protein LMG31887_09410 [Xanthomonas hydrangeae]CAD7722396.1 hypothetical protein LMG31887_09410 [Xanthomonas hydrangeae]CAD7723702.1 hypothetical protein LMG31885_06240 [Xanthomonas hydrangeae]
MALALRRIRSADEAAALNGEAPVQARTIASNEASLRRYQPDQVRRDYLNHSALRYPHFGGD